MTVTRKNVPRPVIITNQKNGFDYMFLVILLLYLFIFLATLKHKAAKNKTTRVSVTFSGQASIENPGNH